MIFDGACMRVVGPPPFLRPFTRLFDESCGMRTDVEFG